MSIYTIRVEAKTDDSYRTITVDLCDQTWFCDCGIFAEDRYCSHIDAALVVGARSMIPEADHWKADRAMAALIKHIVPPDTWKRSWQKRPWKRPEFRDDYTPRAEPRDLSPTSGPYRGCVVFTGQFPQSRNEMIEEARAAGWHVSAQGVITVDVLVAADPQAGSNKLKAAARNGIPIISYNQWCRTLQTGELP